MLKTRYYYAVLAVTAVCCAVILCTNTYAKQKDDSINFLLKTNGECLALYDEGKLIEQYDTVLVSSLPPADRQALKKGIKITSFEQLYSLIEDFDG